ncbi:histidine kinase [Actinocorallia sp. B10E7]|uniref:sensor histidine kinase n=1 Tax=Actinocorallia sp. B10E7 TaxID=3153558 RepID=UPI00325E214A
MTSTARSPSLPRPSRQVLFDATVTAVAFAGTLVQLEHGGVAFVRSGPSDLGIVSGLLAGGAALPLLAWRNRPLAVLVITTVVSVLMSGLGYHVGTIVGPLGPVAALYLLTAGRRAAWDRRTTATVAGLFLAYLGVTAFSRSGSPVADLLHTGMGIAAAYFAGERTRLRREQVAEFEQRALRAERAAERERLLAAAEERTRIARDLHDSAGHAISVIAVRAGAARLRHHRDPGRSLAALTEIEELARQTAAEIDQLVTTLREAADGIEAPPGLSSLDTLIAHHRAAGLKVTLTSGGDARPLARAADQAAYRILQESLTNAARHGTGSADITMAFGDTALLLAVSNPVSDGIRAVRPGGGHGLIGMHERATLLGGELNTVRARDSFKVEARIPYGGHGT